MFEFFIKWLNFVWVVVLFIFLVGLLVIFKLLVVQYFNVVLLQIIIIVIYFGVLVKVLVDFVISVFEELLNGVKGLFYFELINNFNGIVEIVVIFELGIDLDLVQVDVQNCLKKVEVCMLQVVLIQGLQVEQISVGFLLIYVFSYKEGVQCSDIIVFGDYVVCNINNELWCLLGVGKL